MSIIKEIIIETIKSCQDLTDLLKEENISIRNKDIKAIEENIRTKDKLTSKVMALLSKIKQLRASIPKEENGLKDFLTQLQISFNEYQQTARKNALLLRSAHESTAIFIDTIRQAIQETSPSAATYSNNGETRDKVEKRPTVLCTSV